MSMNVNLSVDADHPDLTAASDKPAELNSKPPFVVKLIKGSQTMRFGCSFVLEPPEADQESPSRVLNVNFV